MRYALITPCIKEVMFLEIAGTRARGTKDTAFLRVAVCGNGTRDKRSRSAPPRGRQHTLELGVNLLVSAKKNSSSPLNQLLWRPQTRDSRAVLSGSELRNNKIGTKHAFDAACKTHTHTHTGRGASVANTPLLDHYLAIICPRHKDASNLWPYPRAARGGTGGSPPSPEDHLR